MIPSTSRKALKSTLSANDSTRNTSSGVVALLVYCLRLLSIDRVKAVVTRGLAYPNVRCDDRTSTTRSCAHRRCRCGGRFSVVATRRLNSGPTLEAAIVAGDNFLLWSTSLRLGSVACSGLYGTSRMRRIAASGRDSTATI